MRYAKGLAFAAVLLAPVLAPASGGAQGLPSPLSPTCTPNGPVAITSPVAIIRADGVCLDLSDLFRSADGGKTFALSVQDIALGNVAVIQSLTVGIDTDPFITFGISTLNLGPGPTTYSVLFGTPIVPGFYDSATSSGGVTVSPGQGTASVDNSAVYPTYISGWGTVGAVPTNLGVDNGTGICSATAPASNTCTLPVESNTFGPTFYDNLEALLTYEQTGALSVASWSGRVELLQTSTIPEPGTWVLLGTGLLLVGATRVARQRRG